MSDTPSTNGRPIGPSNDYNDDDLGRIDALLPNGPELTPELEAELKELRKGLDDGELPF